MASEGKKVVIAGSRSITDSRVLEEALKKVFGGKLTEQEMYTAPTQARLYPQIGEVVSGGARGVDALGEEWARKNDRKLAVFPARWHVHGKAAGPVRNQEMARYADMAVILWDGESRGTASMIECLKKEGKEYHLFTLQTSKGK